MNVLIIPEDFTKDQFMLVPLVKAMFASLHTSAKVEICRDPFIRGISQALNMSILTEVIEAWRYRIDVFILCVDRDGDINRRAALNDREEQAQKLVKQGAVFLAENAWQEIEVWVLAGHDLPNAWKWDAIRSAPHPKETYYVPFAKSKELDDGRKKLGEEAAKRYSKVRMKCKQDIQVLELRLKRWIEQQTKLTWDDADKTVRET